MPAHHSPPGVHPPAPNGESAAAHACHHPKTACPSHLDYPLQVGPLQKFLWGALPCSLLLTSRQGKILFANPAFLKRFLLEAETTLGQDIAAFVPDWRQAIACGPAQDEVHKAVVVQGLSREGQAIPLRLRLLCMVHGGASCWLFLMEDLTAQALLEENLRQKFETDRRNLAASTLAHDLNNLLTVSVTATELLAQDTRPITPAREYLDQLQQANTSATRLIRDLMQLCSPRQGILPQTVRLDTVIQKMAGVLRRLLGGNILLHLETPPSPAPVAANPHALEMMLVNLAVNARDAMPEGGDLVISVRRCELSRPLATHTGELPAGAYVTLRAADTGCGIAQELQDRVFHPFFTTKPVGRGTGLGLAALAEQMRQMNGGVTLHSQEGKGARFTLYFPLVEEAAPTPLASPAASDPTHHLATVLLVEPHSTLLALQARLLTQVGHRVLKALTLKEAMNYLDTYPDAIHLLVCATLTDKLGGPQLADYAVRRRPGLRVMFTAASLPGPEVDDCLKRHGGLLLLKPFNRQELLGVMDELLANTPPQATPKHPLMDDLFGNAQKLSFA